MVTPWTTPRKPGPGLAPRHDMVAASVSFSVPPKPAISSRKLHPTTSAPRPATNWPAARAVPPVASTSSTIRTRAPGPRHPGGLERVLPVLEVVASRTHSQGSLPGFRAGTNPAPRLVGHRAAQDETPRLDTQHVGDARAPETGPPWRRPGAEQRPVAEHRGDVLKDDPRFRVVGDGPQRVAGRGAPAASAKVIGCRSSCAEGCGSSAGRNVDAVHLRVRRSRPEQRLQRGQGASSLPSATTSTRPSGKVLGPAAQAETRAHDGHEPAEPDTLHLPRDAGSARVIAAVAPLPAAPQHVDRRRARRRRAGCSARSADVRTGPMARSTVARRGGRSASRGTSGCRTRSRRPAR